MPGPGEGARVRNLLPDRALGVIERLTEEADILMSTLDAVEECEGWVGHRFTFLSFWRCPANAVPQARDPSASSKPQGFSQSRGPFFNLTRPVPTAWTHENRKSNCSFVGRLRSVYDCGRG